MQLSKGKFFVSFKASGKVKQEQWRAEGLGCPEPWNEVLGCPQIKIFCCDLRKYFYIRVKKILTFL